MASSNGLGSNDLDETMTLLRALSANNITGASNTNTASQVTRNLAREASLYIAPVLFGVILLVLILGSVLHYRLKVRAKIAIICREFEKVDEALLKYRALKISLEHEKKRDDGSLKTNTSSTNSSNLDDEKNTQESSISWESDAAAKQKCSSTSALPSGSNQLHPDRYHLPARYLNQIRSYSTPLPKSDYAGGVMETLYDTTLEEEEAFYASNYRDEGYKTESSLSAVNNGADVYMRPDIDDFEESFVDLSILDGRTRPLDTSPHENGRRDSQLSTQRRKFERQQPLYIHPSENFSTEDTDTLNRRSQRFIRQDPILETYPDTPVSTSANVFTIAGSVHTTVSDVTPKEQQHLSTSAHPTYLPSIQAIESTKSLIP